MATSHGDDVGRIGAGWEGVFPQTLLLVIVAPHHNSLERQRRQTIGQVGGNVLFVVHTVPDDSRPGRIISARPASRRERKSYEQGDF
jgi:uncharacterized DUF497 family protein